ncbi:MAG: LysR family transcriptional regulator [Bacillota bacterium]|nr:MAG: LysR family transcriptional regulator [Bacillota bacterium]
MGEQIVDLNTLSTFIKVTEHLNITRAAEELFLSQPAVTKQIKALEAELGAELLIRGPRSLALSPAGIAVLPVLRQVIDLLAKSRDMAREAGSPGRGHIIIASGTAVMSYILPIVLASFRQRYPEAEITVLSGKTTEVVRLVDDGIAHVGLVTSEVSHKSLRVEPLFWDRMGIFASPNRRTAQTLDELAREPWLLFARGTGFRTFIDSVFAVEEVAPRVVMELESVEALKEMAAIGMGYTLLPLKAVTDHLREGRLVHMPITSKVRLARHNSLVYRQDIGLSLANDFISLARELLHEEAVE